MGGVGPSNSQIEENRRREREQQAERAFEGKHARIDKDLIPSLTQGELKKFAALLDADKLKKSEVKLQLIADKFEEIQKLSQELPFAIGFNGGLLQILPALERWREGYLHEKEMIHQVVSELEDLRKPNKRSDSKRSGGKPIWETGL